MKTIELDRAVAVRVTSKHDSAITLAELLIVIVGLTMSAEAAQRPAGSLDASFGVGQIPPKFLPLDGSAMVEDVVEAPDGRIYIGGHFGSVQGVSRDAVARLNPDGSLDETFASMAPLNHDTHTVFLQADGSIIAGYWRSWVIRPNGTVNDSFPTNLLIIGQDLDGMVLGFDDTGSALSPLKRFLPDGEIDRQFFNRYHPLYGSNRRPILMQRDGKTLFFYNAIEGAVARRLSRFNLDGTLDGSFATVTLLDSLQGEVDAAMATQSDGLTLLGGPFDRVNGMPSRTLVRLKSDGALDPSFTAPTELALSEDRTEFVRAMAVQPDGKILVGGSGIGLLRLSADGSVDSTFDAAGLAKAQFRIYFVNRIVLQRDGRILVAGLFESFNGIRRTIVRLFGDSPLLRLGTPQRLPDGTVQISVTDFTGSTTVVEAATDLSPPNWQSIWTNSVSNGAFTVIDSGGSGSPHRFYRALAR